MKILFFTQRPLGLKGNAGTYLLIEEFSKLFEVLSISLPPNKNSVLKSVPYDNLYLSEDQVFNFSHISENISNFNPDAVWIFNHDGWWEFARFVKNLVPNVRVFYDVKTPLLKNGEDRSRIQAKGNVNQYLLDHIFTLSKTSVTTWIPELTVDVSEYELGIDVSAISYFSQSMGSSKKENDHRKFVYIGALGESRKIADMIFGFSKYVKKIDQNCVLDIYGSGVYVKEIENLLNKQGIEKNVCLKGLVPPEKLFSLLPQYDVGIGWVPTEIFSESPSLKVLEYCAAGIQLIATNTSAHASLVDEGFDIVTHDDSADGLYRALENLDNYEVDVINNSKLVKNRSYKSIIEKSILPVLKKIQLKKRIRGVICISSLAEGKGGAERIASELCNNMAERGFSISIAYKSSLRKSNPAYPISGKVQALPYQDFDDLKCSLTNLDPDFFFAFIFNRDVVNYSNLCKELDIPFGYQECTNPDRLVTNNWKKDGKLLPKYLAQWEREIVASSACRIRLVMPGYEESYSRVIQNQVRAFSNPCPEIDISSVDSQPLGFKYVMSVNGLKQNKNFTTLLKAFSLIHRNYPDWKIVDIGRPYIKGRPYHEEVMALINELGIEDKVIIRGPTNNPEQFFVPASIHVISSLSEGCPTVILEAMACGICSVGFSDCSGTNELIEHEKDGLLVSPSERIKNLSQALERLMSDEGLRDRLGANALRRSKEYSSSRIYSEWESIFLDMAGYKSNGTLLDEQMRVDSELAAHYWKGRKSL